MLQKNNSQFIYCFYSVLLLITFYNVRLLLLKWSFRTIFLLNRARVWLSGVAISQTLIIKIFGEGIKDKV